MKDYSVKTLSYSQTKFQTFESSQFQLCKEQALFYEIYICYIIVTKRNLHLLNNFHKFNVIERRLRHFLTIFHKTRISKKKKKKNMQRSKLQFPRILFWTNKHCDEEQSLANSLAEVEKLQSPISANSRCPITGAC